MTKAKKQVKKAGVDYSKVIGGTLAGIGIVIVALLAMILFKELKNDKRFTISYHTDDELAEEIAEKSELPIESVTDRETKIDTSKFITVEKALDLALTHERLTREQVWDIDVELERKFGQVVFEVSFETRQYEYEVYINAESGEIVKSFSSLELD